MPEDLCDLWEEAITRVFESGKGEELEFSIRTREGEEKFFLLQLVPESSREGEVAHVLGISTDVSERHRAETALRESEERYRGLFEHSMVAAAMHEIVTDDAGKPVDYVFLEVNPAFETATGLVAAEIVGKRVTEVLPGIEDTPFIEVYGKVAQDGEPVTFEQFAEPLGRDYLISAYALGEGRFATLFDDVTERRRAEEALREGEENFRSLSELPGRPLRIDLRTGMYDFISPLGGVHDRLSAEELMGMTARLSGPVHPDDLPGWQMAMRADPRTGSSAQGGVPPAHEERGVSLALELHGAGEGRCGSRPFRIGNIRDVTDQGRPRPPCASTRPNCRPGGEDAHCPGPPRLGDAVAFRRDAQGRGARLAAGDQAPGITAGRGPQRLSRAPSRRCERCCSSCAATRSRRCRSTSCCAIWSRRRRAAPA